MALVYGDPVREISESDSWLCFRNNFKSALWNLEEVPPHSLSWVVSQYRDYKNRNGQSWDRQFGNYCELFFTVTANIVTTFVAQNIKDSHFSDCQSHDSDCKLSVWSFL